MCPEGHNAENISKAILTEIKELKVPVKKLESRTKYRKKKHRNTINRTDK